MDFLGTLVSPRARLGEASASLKISMIDPSTLDASSTPPALYTLIKSKGFVVWNESTVQALARKYFSMAPHELTPAEQAWLLKASPSYAASGQPKFVWFGTCPMGATLDESGQPVCGASFKDGVLEVAPEPGTDPCSIDSLPISIKGEVTPAQLEVAKRIAPPGATVCFRYFGGNPSVTSDEMGRARATILAYDDLMKTVEQVENQRRLSGRTYSTAQQNAITHARAVLTEYSQPVEKARPELFKGSQNRTLRAIRQGAKFGALPVLAYVAIIAFAVATVTVAYTILAATETAERIFQAKAGIVESMRPVIEELSKCAADPSRTDAQREACIQQMKALNTMLENLNPPSLLGKTDLGEVAKWSAIGLGILGGIYLFGPAIRGASKATEQSLRISEQRSRARRKLIADISG